MSDFNLGDIGIVGPLNRPFGKLRPVADAAVASSVFIEVGGAGIEANITREGAKIPSIALDASVIADVIGSIGIQPRLKVVRQSVDAGRAVERGATIDLVLARTDGLPGRIVDGIHPGLADLQLGQVFTDFVSPNPAVLSLLRAKTDATALTTAEKELVTGALGQNGVQVDPNDASDFAAAYSGLQAAKLFGG